LKYGPHKLQIFQCERCHHDYQLRRRPNKDKPLHCGECKRLKFNGEARRSWKRKTAETIQLEKNRRIAEALESYGLTLEDYDKLLKHQGGGCAACGTKSSRKNSKIQQRLCVDHDHRTEEVRGLLCHRCNMVLGLINDDIGLLIGLKYYLERGGY
jgi:hypothetical protein